MILSDVFNKQLEAGSIWYGLREIEIKRNYVGTFENIPKTTNILSRYHIPNTKYTLIYSGDKLDYFKYKIGNECKFGDVYSYRVYSAVDVEPVDVKYEALESIEKTISALEQ